MPAVAGFSNPGREKITAAKNEDYTSTHSIHSSRTLLFQASALPAMLDFLQLYHGTVLSSKKTEIMSSIHVICIKEVTVFQTSCKEDFPWAPFWGFCCTHTAPYVCPANV